MNRAARPDASPLALSGSSVSLPVPDALLDLVAERVAGLVLDRLADALPAESSSPWLDVGEAAEHLRCKPKRVYDLVSQGRVPHHREGGRLLFHRAELDAYVRGSDADTVLAPGADRQRSSDALDAQRMRSPHVEEAA